MDDQLAGRAELSHAAGANHSELALIGECSKDVNRQLVAVAPAAWRPSSSGMLFPAACRRPRTFNRSPSSLALSDTNRTCGWFSTSKKSAERRCLSRWALLVLTLVRVDRQFDRGLRVGFEGAFVALEPSLDCLQAVQVGHRGNSTLERVGSIRQRVRSTSGMSLESDASVFIEGLLVVACERCRQRRARVGEASSPDSCDFLR